MIFYRHIGNGLPEVLVDFFLRDAAQGFVTGIHTDVLRLVETAEHADLRKLGYTCQQHKLQVAVGRLEYGVETFQHITVTVFQRSVGIEHIQYRLVVLVNQHHAAATRLFVGSFEHTGKAVAHTHIAFGLYAVLLFPSGHVTLQYGLQFTGIEEISPVEVHVEHRIHFPFRFQPFDGQSAKQFLASLEILL